MRLRRCRNGQYEFCLITSLRKGRWGFPKGITDPGETHVETALKEADEEAGLRGRIVGDSLGESRRNYQGYLEQVKAF